MVQAFVLHGIASCHARFKVPLSWRQKSVVSRRISHMREADFCLLSLRFNVFNAQAAWLRGLNSAAFTSLKKYAAHFFKEAFGETESAAADAL